MTLGSSLRRLPVRPLPGLAWVVGSLILTLPSTTWASANFPKEVKDQFAMSAEPACVLCHASEEGGDKTVVTPFGRSLLQAGALGDADVASLRRALETMDQQGIDSDGDGAPDTYELEQGSDPNVADVGSGGAAGATDDGSGPGSAGTRGTGHPSLVEEQGLIPKSGCSLNQGTTAPRLSLAALFAALVGLALRRRGRKPSLALWCAAPLLSVVFTKAAFASANSAAEAPEADAATRRAYWSSTPFFQGQLGALDVYSGVLFPASDHNLHAAESVPQGFNAVAPTFGVRLAALPLLYAGVEGEGGFAPTRTEDSGRAMLWHLRAHLLGRLPIGAVAPFVVLGTGRLRVLAPSLGDDNDPVVYYGAGAMLALDHAVSARLDLRDMMSQRTNAADGALTHHVELLLSIGLVLRQPSAWAAL